MAGKRFAQLSDLHIGGQGVVQWHNDELHDHAVTLARSSVGAINRSGADFVIVTGPLHEARPASAEEVSVEVPPEQVLWLGKVLSDSS